MPTVSTKAAILAPVYETLPGTLTTSQQLSSIAAMKERSTSSRKRRQRSPDHCSPTRFSPSYSPSGSRTRKRRKPMWSSPPMPLSLVDPPQVLDASITLSPSRVFYLAHDDPPLARTQDELQRERQHFLKAQAMSPASDKSSSSGGGGSPASGSSSSDAWPASLYPSLIVSS